MPTDRSKILTDALRVNSTDVLWYFTADYYDAPVSGLGFFREHLHRFNCFPEDFPEHHIYVLHTLTPEELTEELRIKAKFEALVGTHWSFDRHGKPSPRVVRPKELWKGFYDEETFGTRADPRDRPVVAWFDVLSNDSSA